MIASHAELVIRKTWITRIVPIAAVFVVAGNSFRLAEKLPSALVWAVLIALNVAFLFVFVPKLARKGNQKLVIDDLGVGLQTGKSIARCAWQDVSAIVPTTAGRDMPRYPLFEPDFTFGSSSSKTAKPTSSMGAKPDIFIR